MEVEVDDRLGALGPAGDEVGEQAGELAVGDELVGDADGADEVGVGVVEPVVGGRDGALAHGRLLERVQGVLAVVALDEDGEHRLAGRGAAAEPLAEEAHDPLGDRGEGVDAGRAVGAVGQGVDLVELVAHRPEHRRPVGVDEGLVEPAEPDAAREVADDREAQLGRGDEPVEQVTGGGVVRCRGCRLGEPALEHGGRQRHLGCGALLGQEDAEDGPLEVRAALDTVDAVVPEDALEAPDEVGGQATALGVEGLQVGVEVLARAVDPVLDVRLLADRAVAAQLGEVGEAGQQRHLVGDRRAPRGGQLVAGREVAR